MRTVKRRKFWLFRWRRIRPQRNNNRRRRLGIGMSKAQQELARKREIEELAVVLWDERIDERYRLSRREMEAVEGGLAGRYYSTPQHTFTLGPQIFIGL